MRLTVLRLPSWIHITLKFLLKHSQVSKPWSTVILPLSTSGLRESTKYNAEDPVLWSKQILKKAFPARLPPNLIVVDYTFAPSEIGVACSTVDLFRVWLDAAIMWDYKLEAKSVQLTLIRMTEEAGVSDEMLSATEPLKVDNLWYLPVTEPVGTDQSSPYGVTRMSFCSKLRKDGWFPRACISLQPWELRVSPNAVESKTAALKRDRVYRTNLSRIVSNHQHRLPYPECSTFARPVLPTGEVCDSMRSSRNAAIRTSCYCTFLRIGTGVPV